MRKKDIIIIGGENISLIKIENPYMNVVKLKKWQSLLYLIRNMEKRLWQ